jgi:predicted glycosyltransferase
MTERYDVLLYVQHLLGIGHLRRAAVLARACHRAGLKVVLVTGRPPVSGLGLEEIEVVQLPPARSQDKNFSEIVDAEGRPIDAAWMAGRRERLLEIYHRCRPRVLLIELYPFGRRKMRFELDPLIEAARGEAKPPLIACSLRDIVNRPEQADKIAWMVERFARQFDLLYVHGDPQFFRLEDSFPEARAFAERIRYTGYVTDAGAVAAAARASGGSAGRGEVIVSAGGGAVGLDLMRTALAARALSPLAEVPWRLLTGPNVAPADFETLAAAAPGGVAVERARSDFPEMLTRARLSISQGGYNTVMEVLAAGLPAVVVPFAGVAETEQTQRAAALAARGLITVVPEAGLSPQRLAAAVALALQNSGAKSAPFRLDGADETARQLIAELKAAAA